MNGLKIKVDFNIRDIEEYTKDAIQAYLDYVVDVYSRAGKAMVDDARSRTKGGGDSFGNITWNLRSSIVCGVFLKGDRVFTYGPVLSTGAQGNAKAIKYLDTLIDEIGGEITLIVVAGEDYAAAVESKNYNVITSTGNIAEKILEQHIKQAA